MEYSEKREIGRKKTNFFLYFAVIIANLMCFTCGIVFSWSSPVMPKLTDIHDNPLGTVLLDVEIFALVAFVPLGAAMGPFLGGFLADKLGRKPTLTVSAIPFILTFVLITFWSNLYVYEICRLTQGVCVGLFLTIVPMFVGEIAEIHNRGMLGCFAVFFVTMGMQYSFSVGTYVPIKWFNLSCTAPMLIFLVLFTLLIPESPCYLVVRKKEKEARKSLQKLRCSEIEDELKQLMATAEDSSKTKGGIIEILTTKHLRKSLCLGVGLMVIQQLTAISVINFYMQSIFASADPNIPAELSAIIIGAVQIFGAFLSTLVVDRLGRRKLLLASTSLTTICLLIMSIYFFLSVQIDDVSGINWLPIATLAIYMVFYNLGIGPLAFAVMGEIYPPHVKSAASSVSVSICYFCAFIAAILFPSLSFMGDWFPFLVFAIGNGFGVVFIWFRMPETKGKTLLEIVESFK